MQKEIKRNEQGLLVGVDYKYDSDGYVDWRRMIPERFLYINPDRVNELESRLQKPISEITISEANDNELLIYLDGIQYLLRLRGFTKVLTSLKEARESYAAAECIIEFLPNFETGGVAETYSDNACATLDNTKGIGRDYLVEMATNRALCRTVRNFLNIDILSKEEVSPAERTQSSSPNKAHAELRKLMEKHKYTLDSIKSKIVKMDPEAANWRKLEDLPLKWVDYCIDRIKASVRAN